MAARDTEITADYLRSILNYDPDLGRFVWRKRTDVDPEWNTVWAGRIAGRVDAHGYVVICINNKERKAHRLAWLYVYGAWPDAGMQIDHINQKKADFRICNLRLATRQQNAWNKSEGRVPGRPRGVTWDKVNKKWRATIKMNGKTVNLGRFGTIKEAAERYRAVAMATRGDFAGFS